MEGWVSANVWFGDVMSRTGGGGAGKSTLSFFLTLRRDH
jgi:hypothetical protein